MASDQDICEPPVKRELLDEEHDLEMMNYEIPLQIEVPDDAEVDPLMPVESEPEVAKSTQLSSDVCLTQSIRRATSNQELSNNDINQPKRRIMRVISNSVVPCDHTCGSCKYEVPGSTETGDESCGETSGVQEITIDPTKVSWQISTSGSRMQPVERAHPKNQQPPIRNRKSSHPHSDAGAELRLQNQTTTPQPASEKFNPLGVKELLISEKVGRNRKLLALLVQSVCYLRKVNLDARTVDYADCFAYVVQSNKKLQETLKEFYGSSFVESSKSFVFNYAYLVEKSVEKFIKHTIANELQETRFITLFIEDMSSIVDKSTIVTIAHFLNRAGDVQQRIIELNEIGHDRSAGAVFALFQRTVCQLGLRLKVAGFTYSATLIHPTEITTFNERVERLCPSAKFFHYEGHNLLGMLFGALSHLNQSCRYFFQSITELQIFFKKYLIPAFHHFEQCAHSPYETYDFDYGFVITLRRSYSSVMELFASILRCPGEWDSAVACQAPNFLSFLRHTATRFLIILITQLNLALTDVFRALLGKIEPADWRLQLRQAIANLISIKNFGFEDTYLTALSPSLVREAHANASSFPQDLIVIFNSVIDTAIEFLYRRFDSADFGYVDLDSSVARYYARLRLKQEDVDRFRSQIQLLTKQAVIKDKPLAEALRTIYELNLAKVVPDYVTFLNFAMTIPSSNTRLHCQAVARILEYQRNNSCKTLSRNLVWMERELLADISSHMNITEAVIDILTTNEGAKEFSYKSFGDLVVID